MGNEPEAFEISDNSGATEIHGGPGGITYDTITTSGINVPKTNTKIISGFSMRTFNIINQKLLISYDSGVSFQEFGKFEFTTGNIKGEKTALVIKADSGTIDPSLVEFVINLEAF